MALIDEYRTELSAVCVFSEDTVQTYVSCIVSFSEYLRERFDISVTHAQGDHICQWITALKQTGLSYSRLDHHRSALRGFYALLVKLKVITKNPADGLTPLRRWGISQVKPVSSVTVWKLLDVIDRSSWHEKRNYTIIAMLWALGLRISELTGLTVGCFDPACDPGNRTGLLRVKGKNRKERALFVVDRLYDDLLAYLAHPQSPKGKKEPLFPIEGGKGISVCRVQKRIKEYCTMAGITERLTPHVLRHSFATELFHAGVPLPAICAMMGHEKTAETAVYIKVSDAFKQEALRQLSISQGVLWQ